MRRVERRVGSLRTVVALVGLALAATACKIEKAGSVEWDAAVPPRSLLDDLPAIPALLSSEESLESVVREEISQMQRAESPLEALQARLEAFSMVPAGRGGGWFFEVEVERIATVEANLRVPVGEAGALVEVEGVHLRRRRARNWRGQGRVVKAGKGLADRASGHDDYLGKQVAGAIAVVDWGAPEGLEAAKGWTVAERMQHKFEAALDAGAIACLIRVPETEMAKAAEYLPLAQDEARRRDEPARPQLEFEGLVSEAIALPEGGMVEVAVETESEWMQHRLLLARAVGAEQAERNVTLVMESGPSGGERWGYELATLAVLGHQLQDYLAHGIRLRRSITVVVLPQGAPIEEMTRALLEYGPLPPQNMSSAIVLREFTGAAASHRLHVYGADRSEIGARLEEIALPLGWLPIEEEEGHLDEVAFIDVGVPTLGLSRADELVPPDPARWAESVTAESRVLLRLVLRLAREAQPVRLVETQASTVPAEAPTSTPSREATPDPGEAPDAPATTDDAPTP